MWHIIWVRISNRCMFKRLLLAVQWWCAELQLGYPNADVFAQMVRSLGNKTTSVAKGLFGPKLITLSV